MKFSTNFNFTDEAPGEKIAEGISNAILTLEHNKEDLIINWMSLEIHIDEIDQRGVMSDAIAETRSVWIGVDAVRPPKK